MTPILFLMAEAIRFRELVEVSEDAHIEGGDKGILLAFQIFVVFDSIHTHFFLAYSSSFIIIILEGVVN